MKNNKLKYFIAVFFFCSTLAVSAQSGPSEGTLDGVENDGTTDSTGAAPINDYIYVLAALGLVYVWKLKAFARQEKTTQE